MIGLARTYPIIKYLEKYVSAGGVDILVKCVNSICETNNIYTSYINEMFNSLLNSFVNLNSEYKRITSYENRGCLIKPVACPLSTEIDDCRKGGCTTFALKSRYSYFISMRDMLKMFLEIPNV